MTKHDPRTWLLHVDSTDADTLRRGRNVILLASLISVASLCVAGMMLGRPDRAATLAAALLMLVVAVGCVAAARRGWATPAAAALIASSMLLIVGNVLATGQLRSGPQALIICVMLAGMTLPPIAVGVTLLLSLSCLTLFGAVLVPAAQAQQHLYDNLALAGILVSITALVSHLGSRSFGRTLALMAQTRDELQRSEAALRANEAKYRQLVEQIPGITYLAPIDAPLSPVYASPQVADIFGFSAAQWTTDATRWLRQIHPDDRERVSAELERIRSGGAALHDEYRMLDGDGNTLWVRDMRSIIRDAHGTPLWLQGLLLDATDRKQLEERLYHAATFDALTQLPNRATILDSIAESLAHTRTGPVHIGAVLFLDLDRFKQVNDTLGHGVGDQLLRVVGQRLSSCVRTHDVVGRLGGDEFVVVLNKLHEMGDAIRVAERITQALALPVYVDGAEVRTAASIGIAQLTTAYDRPEDVLRDADTALYRAKSRGKGCHVLFDASTTTTQLTRSQLALDLRRALADDQLQLHYQPIVSLTTSHIDAVEALVRWHHPELGWVAPLELITVAEEAGLSEAVGERVLRKACMQLRAWAAAGIPPCTMTVNLAARQFQQPSFSATVATVLGEAGIDPHLLKLEITESDAIQHADAHLDTLRAIKALGVQLAVDDFGTGCSSLSSLKRFSIDTLKIDRAFVRDITGGPHGATVVRTILAIAHSLHWDVVAEGVETEDQVRFLQAHGCDAIQGYIFSQPLPADAMAQMLVERTTIPVPEPSAGA